MMVKVKTVCTVSASAIGAALPTTGGQQSRDFRKTNV
jgi:hypothetical protein